MRIFLILVFTLIAAMSTLAQSETETLEWLKSKSVDIKSCGSDAVGISYIDGSFSVSGYTLRCSDEKKGGNMNISWKNVTDVKVHPKKGWLLQIVSNEIFEGKKCIVELYFDVDGDERKKLLEKYAKAMKHFATLKGAKLVADDLF